MWMPLPVYMRGLSVSVLLGISTNQRDGTSPDLSRTGWLRHDNVG